MPYGVENLTDEQLKQVITMYEEKIPRLLWHLYDVIYAKAYDMLSEREKDTLNAIIDGVKTELATDLLPMLDPDYLIFLQNKIERLRAKKKAAEDELAKRTLTNGGGSENPHHTDYFIDFVNGDDTNDGLTPATAWKTIPQYTTNTVRSPGDVAYVRRGQTHLYNTLDIVFDEDGQPNNPIVLMADDGTGWPDETGLAKPIISFGDLSYQFLLGGDDYWKFEDFEIIESDDPYGGFNNNTSHGTKFVKIDIHDNDPGRTGLRIITSFDISLEKCTFYSNDLYNVLIYRAFVRFSDCTFNGGPVTTDYGIYALQGCFVEIENSSFGETTAHDLLDINAINAKVVGRNVTLASPAEVSVGFGFVRIEDHDGTKLSNRGWFRNGNIIRDTTVVRAGGATSSARMEPNSNCGLLQPLELCAFTEELSRWLTAGSHTCKMYIRGENWVTFPTADELYLEVLYFDGATAKRASVKSTEVLTANDVWTEFSVSFDLNSDSPVYANIILKKFETDETHRIYVDVLPVWS